jgi:hypothetical protein
VASPKSARGHASGFDEVRIYLALALHASPGSTNARVHLPFLVTPLLT